MALGANLKISIFDPPTVGGTYYCTPAFKPHIIILIEAFALPVWGIVLALYSVALVVGQASVLMRNRASQSAVPALCLPAIWGHIHMDSTRWGSSRGT